MSLHVLMQVHNWNQDERSHLSLLITFIVNFTFCLFHAFLHYPDTTVTRFCWILLIFSFIQMFEFHGYDYKYLRFTECLRQLEFKTFCNRFVGFWSKFYHHRNLCRPICHAGNVYFSWLPWQIYAFEFHKSLFFSASTILRLNIRINIANTLVPE